MVLVPVGHLDARHPQDWQALRARARAAITERLATLGLGDLDGREVAEETLGPAECERDLNLANGSAFGLSHNFAQLGYLRLHNVHARYHNLYFVGASTHPGTGLPIVLLSARLTVERILARRAGRREHPPARAQESRSTPDDDRDTRRKIE